MPTQMPAQPAVSFSAKCPRRHPRALFSVPVTLYHLMPGGVQTSRGISLDISEAGLGALVQGDLRVGETVEIDLPLSERMLNAVAIVRHTSSMRSGFEFLGLTPEERVQITHVVGNS
jgi:PilZ domain